MALTSFKELLLRRIIGDSALEDLIKTMSEEVLADKIAESLIKIRSTTTGNKGLKANNAVKQFANKFIDPESHEAEMVRDALGHHVSHYKAAVNDKSLPPETRQNLIKQHANKVFQLLDLAGTVKPWTDNKLDLSYVDPAPWERNAHNRRERKSDGKFKIDTKNIGLHQHAYKDYDFLQQPPHHGSQHLVHEHYHDKAYPFENIAISNHGKNRYINVDDMTKSPGVYKPHEFDFHPILEHFKEPAGAREGTDADARYLADQDKFDLELPHADEFTQRHDALRTADPEGYSKRGTQAAQPVHSAALPVDTEITADRAKWGHLKPERKGKKPIVAPPTPVQAPEAPKKITYDPSILASKLPGEE